MIIQLVKYDNNIIGPAQDMCGFVFFPCNRNSYIDGSYNSEIVPQLELLKKLQSEINP